MAILCPLAAILTRKMNLDKSVGEARGYRSSRVTASAPSTYTRVVILVRLNPPALNLHFLAVNTLNRKCRAPPPRCRRSRTFPTSKGSRQMPLSLLFRWLAEDKEPEKEKKRRTENIAGRTLKKGKERERERERERKGPRVVFTVVHRSHIRIRFLSILCVGARGTKGN